MQPDLEKNELARKDRADMVDATISLLEHLHAMFKKAMPDGQDSVSEHQSFDHLSVDQRIALGNNAAGELEAIAFQLDPIAAIERVEIKAKTDYPDLFN